MTDYPTKKSGGVIRSALLIAFISLALLEAVGLVYHYINNATWFYTRPIPHDSVVVSKPATPRSQLVLHPYLGFIRRPGIPVSRAVDNSRLERMLPDSTKTPNWLTLQSNSSGFFAAENYPSLREHRDDYLIGVFGGSVAQWFALQGAERLRQQLQAAPEFSGRNIRILNFAQGGFKQPQQLQTLSYFLAQGQALDFVLNIDGFNELALGDINQQRDIDIVLPSAQHMIPLLKLVNSQSNTPEDLSRTVQIINKQVLLQKIDKQLARTLSAGLHMMLLPLQTLLQNQLSVLQYEAQASMPDSRNTLYPLATLAEPMSDTFQVWAGAAKIMQDLSHANGIEYLELVQPNQYASKKTLLEQEQKIALRENSPFRSAIERYYPKLDQWIATQRSQGLNIKSATGIFDALQRPIYVDNCCHYNQLGNEVLAEVAAQAMLDTIRNNRAR